MSHSNLLLAVEEILDGRLNTMPSRDTFNEDERSLLGNLIALSRVGNLDKTRGWLEEQKRRGHNGIHRG